jgi:hypothetical protein
MHYEDYEAAPAARRLPSISADTLAFADRLVGTATHAARLERLAADYDVPPSTLRALIADGRGPRTFTIGRLVYVRRSDWVEWLDTLAEAGGTGPLSPTNRNARAA